MQNAPKRPIWRLKGGVMIPATHRHSTQAVKTTPRTPKSTSKSHFFGVGGRWLPHPAQNDFAPIRQNEGALWVKWVCPNERLGKCG